MHPILFQFGPIKIYSYGFAVAVAFLVAAYLAKQEAVRQNISPEKMLDLSLGAIIFGILGARILYILQNLRYFLAYPKEIVMLQRGGLSFYGGFFAALVFSVFFLRQKKMPVLATFDLVSPYLALAQAIGRFGCFLNGCCYGQPTNMFPCVYFPGEQITRYPVQLYSAVGLIAIFLILRLFQVRGRKPNYFSGQVFLLYCLLSSALRFFLEYLRGDNLRVFANLTIHQLISIGIFVTTGIIWWSASKDAKVSTHSLPRR